MARQTLHPSRPVARRCAVVVGFVFLLAACCVLPSVAAAQELFYISSIDPQIARDTFTAITPGNDTIMLNVLRNGGHAGAFVPVTSDLAQAQTVARDLSQRAFETQHRPVPFYIYCLRSRGGFYSVERYLRNFEITTHNDRLREIARELRSTAAWQSAWFALGQEPVEHTDRLRALYPGDLEGTIYGPYLYNGAQVEPPLPQPRYPFPLPPTQSAPFPIRVPGEVRPRVLELSTAVFPPYGVTLSFGTPRPFVHGEQDPYVVAAVESEPVTPNSGMQEVPQEDQSENTGQVADAALEEMFCVVQAVPNPPRSVAPDSTSDSDLCGPTRSVTLGEWKQLPRPLPSLGQGELSFRGGRGNVWQIEALSSGKCLVQPPDGGQKLQQRTCGLSADNPSWWREDDKWALVQVPGTSSNWLRSLVNALCATVGSPLGAQLAGQPLTLEDCRPDDPRQRFDVVPNDDTDHSVTLRLAGQTWARDDADQLVLNVEGDQKINGATVILWKKGAGDRNSRWRLTLTPPAQPIGGGLYSLTDVSSSECLTPVLNQGSVTQQNCNDVGSLSVYFRPQRGGQYMLASVDGRCLGVSGASTGAGAALQWQGCDSGQAQQLWLVILYPAPSGSGSDWAVLLQNVNSGLVANVSGDARTAGGVLIQWPWIAGQNNSLWTLSRGGVVVLPRGFYTLTTKYTLNVTGVSPQCLASDDNVQLTQHACATQTPWQQWLLVPVHADRYELHSSGGACLDVGNNATAMVNLCNDSLGQQWSLWQDTDGTVVIENVMQRSVLTILAGQGAGLQPWEGRAEQAWVLQAVILPVPTVGGQPLANGDAVQLKVASSGKCLDLPGDSRDSGVGMIQYTCGTQKNQQFTFYSTAATSSTPATQTYQIKTHPLQCLTIVQGQLNLGAPVVQQPCDAGTPGQDWYVRSAVDSGSSLLQLAPGWELINADSGLGWNVEGGSGYDLAKIIQWSVAPTAGNEIFIPSRAGSASTSTPVPTLVPAPVPAIKPGPPKLLLLPIFPHTEL